MPKPEANSIIKEIFIEETSGDGETLYRRVDHALATGALVWVRSPLLQNLSRPLGQRHGGESWLRVLPPQENPGRYLRTRDIVLSALALAILAPVMLIIGILVKLSSPGPVFFMNQVVGESGRQFTWRKFRSMTVVSPDEDAKKRLEAFRAYAQRKGPPLESQHGVVKVIESRRVTAFGGIIRKHSIDELPQLWNVLRGQMSLVGPRPCLPYEMEFYQGWSSRRFLVPPGLTGLWQVFGRGCASHSEAAAMDVYYTYCRSFSLDLYLILRTLGIMLSAQGAA